MSPTPGNPEPEDIAAAYKLQLEIIRQDETFLDRKLQFFVTQLTTGLAELEYLGYQKKMCQAEQELALAIGRTEHYAYWYEMERRVNWGRVRCEFANGELQGEIGRTKRTREGIDGKARAIRGALAAMHTD